MRLGGRGVRKNLTHADREEAVQNGQKNADVINERTLSTGQVKTGQLRVGKVRTGPVRTALLGTG